MTAVPLTTDPLVTVVRDGGSAPTDVAELAELPWVLDSASSYLSDLVLRICRQAGFEPRVVGRYRSFGLMLQQVEAGAAVTVLPALAIDGRYRVATAPLEPRIGRSISMLVRGGAAPRPAVRVVLDALRSR